MDLKELLKKMKSMSDDQIRQLDLTSVTDQMLQNLGSVDAELRDQLIYQTFTRFILNDYLSEDTLTDIFNRCFSDEYLFYNLGHTEDDSVFTRSFSSLVIALILYKDQQKRFLQDKMIHQAFEKAVHYLRKEKDLRGYIDEQKGWAHSIAHGADMMSQFASHPAVSPEIQFPYILETISACILKKEQVYTDEEDERLILIIEKMIKRGLSEKQLLFWTEELISQYQKLESKRSSSFRPYCLRTNLLNFLKTLYFRLMAYHYGADTRKRIETFIIRDHQNMYLT